MEVRVEGQTQKDNTGSDYREYSCPIIKNVKTGASYERFFKEHKEGRFTEKLVDGHNFCILYTFTTILLSKSCPGLCCWPP